MGQYGVLDKIAGGKQGPLGVHRQIMHFEWYHSWMNLMVGLFLCPIKPTTLSSSSITSASLNSDSFTCFSSPICPSRAFEFRNSNRLRYLTPCTLTLSLKSVYRKSKEKEIRNDLANSLHCSDDRFEFETYLDFSDEVADHLDAGG